MKWRRKRFTLTATWYKPGKAATFERLIKIEYCLSCTAGVQLCVSHLTDAQLLAQTSSARWKSFWGTALQHSGNRHAIIIVIHRVPVGLWSVAEGWTVLDRTEDPGVGLPRVKLPQQLLSFCQRHHHYESVCMCVAGEDEPEGRI